MKCEHCQNELISAIDVEGKKMVLVQSPPFYGLTYGHLNEATHGGVVYELVRPLLGTRILHSAVCDEGKDF